MKVAGSSVLVLITNLALALTWTEVTQEPQRPDAYENFSPAADTYTYMTNGRDAGLQVVEVSGLTSSWEVGFYDTPGCVRDVSIQGRSGGEEDNNAQSWPPPCLDNREVRIEVLPDTPTEGDSITLRISGTSGDACVPTHLTYEIQGNLIDVYAGEPSCGITCITIPIAWAFDVQLGPLSPGFYMVRFYIVCQWSPPPPPPPSEWECSSTAFTVAPCYDFNGNGQVDIEDIQDVVDRWRQQVGLPYDCDSDGFITVRDIMCAVARWGETCA